MKVFALIKLYLLTLCIFLLLDMIWINVIAHTIYINQIGYLLRPQPFVVPGVLFYLIYIVGLLTFVVVPSLHKKKSVLEVLFLGGLFGFFAYCTYDLTNYATVKDWPLPITLIDILWGYTLSALVSAMSFLIARKLS